MPEPTFVVNLTNPGHLNDFDPVSSVPHRIPLAVVGGRANADHLQRELGQFDAEAELAIDTFPETLTECSELSRLMELAESDAFGARVGNLVREASRYAQILSDRDVIATHSGYDELIRRLETLAQQKTWRRFELSGEFTDEVLDRLFADGFIEVRLWWRTQPTSEPSPISHGSMAQWINADNARNFGNAGPFGRVLQSPLFQGDCAPEFRLSHKGWKELHEAERAGAPRGEAVQTAETATPAPPAPPQGEPSSAPDALPHFRRRERAQQQLTAAIDDLLARFENDGPYGADFFGPSPAAADLAATLGFAAPPVEVVMIRRPESHPVFDKDERVVMVGVVRFNDPNGLTNVLLTLHAFAEAVPDGSIPPVAELPPDLRAVARGRSILESWSRKVKSLDVQTVMHTPSHIPSRDNSLAIMAFKSRLAREIAGLGDFSQDEEMFWYRKHDDAMKKGLGGVLDQISARGSGFQLVAKVDPTAGRRGTSALEPESSKSDSPYVFRRTGTMWEVRFGQERGHFKDKRGYRMIATLLRQPNPTKPPSAISLGGYDERADTEDRTFQPIIDSEGKARIQNRIEDVQELLAQAERNNDAAADQHRAELDQLSVVWAEAHGLGGRDRDLSKSVQKNAQSNVGQRVKEAINEIAEPMPKLAEHLRAAISTGVECAYRPAINISWEL